MNHAITIGGLLLGLSVLVGLVIAAISILSVFAAGMSDATGGSKGWPGCLCFFIGLALFVGGLVGLFRP